MYLNLSECNDLLLRIPCLVLGAALQMQHIRLEAESDVILRLYMDVALIVHAEVLVVVPNYTSCGTLSLSSQMPNMCVVWQLVNTACMTEMVKF